MKKILIPLVLVTLASAIALSSTSSFFSDTETSDQNIFEAGKVDLKLAYQSLFWNIDHWEQNYWNWSINDLTYQFFFRFEDVKPGDLSEGTISIQVDDNPAWLCANVKLTGLPENQSTQPEQDGGDTPDDGNWDGELQDELNFIIWADDGDHTFEQAETIIYLGNLDFLPRGVGNEGLVIPLIDSQVNYWGEIGQSFGPGVENRVALGMGWCMGDLILQPQHEANGVPQQRPPGFLCSGDLVGNIAQTDAVHGDISFYVEQTRNNLNFQCESL